MLSKNDALLDSIDATREALKSRPDAHWIVAFSGGKDSTAVLKIFTAAYKTLKDRRAKVSIIYCDTGVENILLDRYVKTY